MPRPLIPDTTELIAAIRSPRPTFFDTIMHGQVWLSSVVACELYAGTRSQQERQLLDKLVRGAARAERLLIPTMNDWTMAGTLMARRVRLEGAIRPRDHLADVLIVISAARLGGEIATANRRHFLAWTALAQRAGLDVTVASGVTY